MEPQRKLFVLLIGTVAALALALGVAVKPASSEGRRRPQLAPVPEHVPPAPENTTKCNYQEPIPYLIRSNHIARGRMSREERIERSKLFQKAVEFRTKNYGYFKGFGRPEWNPRTPAQNTKVTTFFGKRVRLNKRIIPALECVETQLKQVCTDTPYQPRRLSGLRTKNTYHTHEISNHCYGIAIDLDPTENTCCGCVGHWAEHPLCGRPAKTIYDRMAMPECWVHTFERFGFYWLGRDRLQDTMHFEFLGHPDKILRAGAGSEAGEGE